MTDHGFPNYRHFMWPVLQAVTALGGSARISEVVEKVIEDGGYTEEQRALSHELSGGSILEGRMGFARSALKAIGALDNSERGVWVLTDKGRTLTEDQVLRLHRKYERERYRARKAAEIEDRKAGLTPDSDELEDHEPGSDGWKTDLLTCLWALSADAFERLAQRLLREAGFRSVEVVGKSGDGGIDGVGVYRLSLVSFPTYFQCKRYRGSVSAGAVRDFRGAMVGRGDKGLLITTGSFTRAARQEATRDGAPPIDLVDGEELCELLKEYKLGVAITKHVIEKIEVKSGFFDHL